MDIFDAIFRFLQASATLTAQLGTPLKLFQEYGPQASTMSARPYIIFTNHSTDREVHLKGASAIADFTIQFDVYANDLKTRQIIGEALRNYLHSRINVLLTDSSGNTGYLQWSDLIHDMNTPKPPPDGSELPIFCREMIFRIVTDEAIPSPS